MSKTPAQSATGDHRRYLDPTALARIEPLDLRARLIVEGYFSGMHASPFQGSSVEFAEHRQYAPGDDLRHLDWKVYGRTNKRYVKQYVEETNLICMLVVDSSASMTFRSDAAPMSKFEYAATTAASMAYLAIQQHDSAGIVTFNESVEQFYRPTNHLAQWKLMVHGMHEPSAAAKTSIRAVLDDLAERMKQRCLVVLISDLFDDADEILRGLQHLRFRRNDVIVLQVLDPAELTFPMRGPTRFEGLETAGKLVVDPTALRNRYLEEVERFVHTMQQGCRKLQIDFAQFNTAEGLGLSLSAYLANRAART